MAESWLQKNPIDLNLVSQTFIDGRLEFKIKSDVQSDPLPVKYLGNSNWMSYLEARPGLNLIRIDKSVEIEVANQDKSVSFGLITRSLGRLLITEESVRYLGVVAKREAQTKDWLVDAQMSVQGFSGTGIQWQKKYDLSPHIEWRVGAQGLMLTNLQSRDISGQMGYLQLDQTYRFEVMANDKNSRLKLPYQDATSKFGQGLLFQSHLAWQSENFGVQFGVKDFGILRWQSMPQRVMNLNTNVTERDTNGYLLYRPLVTGQNSQSSVKIKSPWTVELMPHWSPSQGYYLSMPWQYIPSFGWLKAYRWTDSKAKFPWAVEWREHERNLVLQSQWGPWSADLGLSSFNAHSRSQLFKLSYARQFR